MSLLTMMSLLVAWFAVSLAVGLAVGGAVRLRDQASGPLPATSAHRPDLRAIS